MRILLFWCVVWIFLLIGCDEDDSSPVVILVSPNQWVMDGKAGDKIVFSVEAFADKGQIENIRITSKDAQYGLIHLLDSSLNVGRARFDYQYVVPVMTEDSVEIELKFEASNSRNFTSVSRTLCVLGGDVLLQEESGYTLYSAAGSKVNAFRISDSQLLFASQEPMEELDIFDYHDEAESADVLGREWRSGSGIKFVRFNDFNYPQATAGGVKNAYQEGVKYTSVRSISADDIILVGKEGEALGVIKVVAVFDEDGNTNDRYIFNFKKIEKRKVGEG